MTKPSQEECPACKSRGWLFCNSNHDSSPAYVIQQCHACEIFANDLAALEAVVNAAAAQPELLRLAERISRLTHEGETGDDGQSYEPSSEDAIATLNQLIREARQLLGIAEKCSECGEIVPYIIGCPDGAEICRACFEAGQH